MAGVPTIADLQNFLFNIAGVPAAALPIDAPVIAYAFDYALSTVNRQLCAAWSPPGSWTPYQRAVYNLATDILINWAQDPAGEPVYRTTPTGQGLQYFAWLRYQYSINQFVAGVISSSGDEGTSQSLVVPKAFEGLTISQLTNLKTPFGREYLALTQSVGTLWGMS